MKTFFSELRRRHVFKVAVAYGVVAWLLIEIAATTFPILGLPDWSTRLVLALVFVGFPIAVVLAWAFELTPQGVRRAEPLNPATDARSARRPFGSRAAGWVGVGMVVGLASVGAYSWTRVPESTAGSGPGEGAGAVRSIAVLPFSGVGGGDSRYFSEGITEELLNTLSQVPQLRVAARTSSFSFQGQDVTLDSIARALRVGYLLEGSVRAAGDRVRISVRLVDASSGSPLWSHTYDREAEDVLAVQEEISVAIANALQVQLAGGDASRFTRSRSVNPEAYELYLRGRHLIRQRVPERFVRAIESFQAAVQRDPAFAAAYSGLADAYALSEDAGVLRREEAFPKALAAAQRALELDELQAEAHTSLGHIYFHQKDWEAGEKAYRRALELNPSYATASHWYGNLLLATNRPAEALRQISRAYELDPLSPPLTALRGSALYYARQFEPAVTWYQERLQTNPDDVDLHNWLARVYLASGNPAAAIAPMRRVLELIPPEESDVWARAQLAAAHAAAGQREEARRILREIEAMPPNYGAASRLAMAYGYLGDLERAFHWLEAAVEHDDWTVPYLRMIPLMDPLRHDPRFEQIVRRTEQRAPGW